MCGRYYIEQDAENEMLAAYIRQAQERADRQGFSMVCAGEVRPTNIVPVLAPNARNRMPGAFPMKWGFTHPTRRLLVFNTRSETAADKPLFRACIQDRRCAVPASGYYEWVKRENGGKSKHAFFQQDRQMLYLAGLYLRPSPDALPCFTILTRDAAPELKPLHARMPVILAQDMLDQWLSPACAYADMLCQAVADLAVRAV